jgi:hypothetical protein
VHQAHVGVKLGSQEDVKKVSFNETCPRVTEKILEEPVNWAPPNITWLSMEIRLVSAEEARFCLNNPSVTPFSLTYGDREFLTFREAIIYDRITFEQPEVWANFSLIVPTLDDEERLMYRLIIPW